MKYLTAETKTWGMWESFQDDKHVSPAIQYNVDCVTLVNIEIPVGVGNKPDETSDDSVNI